MVVGPGTVLEGGFALRECVWMGRTGQVFVARDQHLDREVLVQVMSPRLGFAPLRRKVRTLAAIHHPGLLMILGVHKHADLDFVVMERLAGISLAMYLERQTLLPTSEAIELLIAICDTLGALHDAGLAHGDVRPEQVMLGATGRVVLLEYGVANVARRDRYRHADDVAADDSAVAVRARDLHAVGVLAFELLTGRLPRRDSPLDQQLPTQPKKLVALIDDLLGHTTRSAHAVANQLRTLANTVMDMLELDRKRSGKVHVVGRPE